MHLRLLKESTAHQCQHSLQMCRGFYRSSTGKWYIPEGIKSSGACQKDSRSGGMRTEVKAVNGAYELSFSIPAQLAPLFLAFELQSADSVELSRAGQRFAVPIGMSAGRTTRMGESCSLTRVLHPCPQHPSSLGPHTFSSRFTMKIVPCMRYPMEGWKGVQGCTVLYKFLHGHHAPLALLPNVGRSSVQEMACTSMLSPPSF